MTASGLARRPDTDIDVPLTDWPSLEFTVTDVEAYPAVSSWVYALAYMGFPIAVLACLALVFALTVSR